MKFINKFCERLVRDFLRQANVRIGGPKAWDITVNDDRFYRMVVFGGLLGLGDAYVAGYWDCHSVSQFIDRAICAGLLEWTKWAPSAIWDRFRHFTWNQQSVRAAKRNSGSHYDLSNALYVNMLDPYMQYTCAFWLRGDDSLDSAQVNKLQMICDKLHLRTGMTVLDIGCGWGGLARFMAEKNDVAVTGINLSHEQIAFAEEKSSQSRSGRWKPTFRYLDYRDAPTLGKFDRIVSVGMIEHVGAKNLQTFMKTTERCLKPGGIALLHMFGRDSRSVPICDTWTHRHIFPGIELPTLDELIIAARGKLCVRDVHEMGEHYAQTLISWHRNFTANWPIFEHTLEGRRFSKRGWEYYLLSAAGAFRSQRIRLWQIVLTHPETAGYRSVRPEISQVPVLTSVA